MLAQILSPYKWESSKRASPIADHVMGPIWVLTIWALLGSDHPKTPVPVRHDEDAVPRPPPAGAVAVAGGGATWAVAAGAAGNRGCRPGGDSRGREQRGAPRGAQAWAEAAAVAVAAAVPGRGQPAPREEGNAAASYGGKLGEALLRRRAAGGRAGALQREDGICRPFRCTGIPTSFYFEAKLVLFLLFIWLVKKIEIIGVILILNMPELLDLSVNLVPKS